MAHKTAKRAPKKRAVTEHQPTAEEHVEAHEHAKGAPVEVEAHQSGLTALAARVAALEQRAGFVPSAAVDPTQSIKNARLPSQGQGGPALTTADGRATRA